MPEEFAATIAAEVSWNLDLLAEGRQRPTPNSVLPRASEGDDALGDGHRGSVVQGESPPDSDQDVDADVIIEHPFSGQTALHYKPILRLLDADVMDIAHRLAMARRLDGRAKDKKDNVMMFFDNFADFYSKELHIPAPCERTDNDTQMMQYPTLASRIKLVNDMLHHQKSLVAARRQITIGQCAPQERDLKEHLVILKSATLKNTL